MENAVFSALTKIATKVFQERVG